jgi:hypothetical protein
MRLRVKRKNLDDLEDLVYESPASDVSWNFEIAEGVYKYDFSGNVTEKKFLVFRDVAVYRNALRSLLLFAGSEISAIQDRFDKNATVINHNLIETCKHIRDTLYGILPDLSGSRNYEEKIDRVARNLKKISNKEIARTLLELKRSIVNLQTQISGLEIISGDY